MSGVHKSAAVSAIPDEIPSSEMIIFGVDPPSSNASSSRDGGQPIATESSNNIITADAAAASNQLEIYRENKARLSVRKILTKFLGYLNPIKSCDNKGQGSINVYCISKVIKWFCKHFVNAWNLEELVLISFNSRSVLVNGNDDHLDRLKKILGNVKLTDQNGRPTSLLVDLIRDIVSQLIHLHESGKTHGDLKPQNVVIIKGIRRLLCAKLSDISKSGHHSTGCRAEDMYNLGCVLFFCITGQTPFGDNHDTVLKFLKDFPEAYRLISLLLSPNPEGRPKANEVSGDPLLWDPGKRCEFICDTTDLRREFPQLLKALEGVTLGNIGVYKKGMFTWDQIMHKDLINHMLKYTQYDFGSVLDLLRFIRNLWTHYKQVPKNVKVRIGVKHRKDLDGYITSRFPNLLMKIYEVVRTQCKEEESFEEYFKGSV